MGGRGRVEVIHLKPLEVEPDDGTLQKLYMWVDEIPLSRPKRNLARDFSDGVMTAELVRHFIPKLVDLHNYAGANSSNQKESNWFHLNKKVFVKLKFEITAEVIRGLAQCRRWVAENFLMVLREKIDIYLAHKQLYGVPTNTDDLDAVAHLDDPEVDQHTAGLRPRGQQIRGLSHHVQSPSQPYSPSWQSPVPHGIRSPKQDSVEMVPREELTEKEKILADKLDTIQILNTKIQKMEHLITLKDVRIDDLTEKVEQFMGQKKKKPTPIRRN